MEDGEEAVRREEVERMDERSLDGRREPQHLLHISGASADPSDFSESVAKRFCESKRYSVEGEKRFQVVEADSPVVAKRFVEPVPGPRVLSYPHSMPASPTMMDHRNSGSLSLLRHFARVGSGESRDQEQRQENNHPLDYRFQRDTSEVRGGGRSRSRSSRRSEIRSKSMNMNMSKSRGRSKIRNSSKRKMNSRMKKKESY